MHARGSRQGPARGCLCRSLAGCVSQRSCCVQDQEKLQRFKAMVTKPLPGGAEASPEALVEMLQRGEGVPEFQNGRMLRDYQVASFKWMVQHVLKGQNCILGDEMGLGKTAQVRLVLPRASPQPPFQAHH